MAEQRFFEQISDEEQKKRDDILKSLMSKKINEVEKQERDEVKPT